MTKYSFVIDADGKQLAPTRENKAWVMVRQGRAKLINKFPMTIQLLRSIPEEEACTDEIRCGIDDGSSHVGIALVQRCQTRNKVLFKGTIEQRLDVKTLMDNRRCYRRYHRKHKRYRAERFNNRSASKRKDRLAPSILQKKQAILRVLNRFNKYVKISTYWLEDVAIDIRAISDGYKPRSWMYIKSNRLDENLRKATILRDNNICQECGKKTGSMEVHHIRARHDGGADTINNLITLCPECHAKTLGHEEDFMEKYFTKIGTKDLGKVMAYASHVMVGKNYLRDEISKLGPLILTTGGDTANFRIDYGIEKSHANDAICITNLIPDTIDLYDWIIKPMRRKSKAKTDNVLGIKHKDLVSYTYNNGETYTGYVTALYPSQLALNFQSSTKHCKKVNARKCKLIWKYTKIYWL